MFSIIVCSFFY